MILKKTSVYCGGLALTPDCTGLQGLCAAQFSTSHICKWATPNPSTTTTLFAYDDSIVALHSGTFSLIWFLQETNVSFKTIITGSFVTVKNNRFIGRE